MRKPPSGKQTASKTAGGGGAAVGPSESGPADPGAHEARALYGKYFAQKGRGAPFGLDLRTDLYVAERIHGGVPTAAVFDAIDSGVLEAQVVYDVIVPRRTLAHRRQKNQRLSPEESDRLARVLRVHARAEEALGSREKGARWLRKANRALGGRIPLDLLASDAGARAVETVIGRIEHGIFS